MRTLVLDKSDSMLVLHTSVSGEVVVECDRCLEDCDVPIAYEGDLTVRFSDEVHRLRQGEQCGLPKANRCRSAQYIYESIVISLPYRRVIRRRVQSGHDGSVYAAPGRRCPTRRNNKRLGKRN